MEMLEQGSVGNQSILSNQWPQFHHILVVGELHIARYLVKEQGSVASQSDMTTSNFHPKGLFASFKD